MFLGKRFLLAVIKIFILIDMMIRIRDWVNPLIILSFGIFNKFEIAVVFRFLLILPSIRRTAFFTVILWLDFWLLKVELFTASSLIYRLRKPLLFDNRYYLRSRVAKTELINSAMVIAYLLIEVYNAAVGVPRLHTIHLSVIKGCDQVTVYGSYTYLALL